MEAFLARHLRGHIQYYGVSGNGRSVASYIYFATGLLFKSYCLMPNPVHLILEPSDESGLSRAVGETYRRHSGYINARLRVTGHLFQGRFGCVALNPVKAKLAATAADKLISRPPILCSGRAQQQFDLYRVVAEFDGLLIGRIKDTGLQ
jgi:hypothetical protein